MIFLAIAAIAADAVTYMLMVLVAGPDAEMNWFVRAAGPANALAMKIALMVFIVSLAYIVYEKATTHVHDRRRAMWLVLAVALVVGVVGTTSNIRVLVS